jgi:hypothetical protein
VNAGVVVRRSLTTALTCLAFWNSYTHTVDWFTAHGQEGAAHFLALIPEAGLILALLFLASGNLTRMQRGLVAVVGFGSVGITVAANLAGAGPGRTGQVAALVAPVFAVLGFGLEVCGPAPAPGPVAVPDQSPGPVTVHPDQNKTGPLDQTSGPRARTTGPLPMVHPDQGPGPNPKRSTPKPRTTTRRTRTTDQQHLARVTELVAEGVLPDHPSATRIQAALGINKTKAGHLRDLYATQADTPTRTLAG